MTHEGLAAEYRTAVAAVAAGRAAVMAEQAGEGVTVLDTAGRDVKISTDLAAEAEILKVLGEESAHPVLAEESSSDSVPSGEFIWVVDPLDGSANFSRDVPLHAVAVGLLKDGEPVVGVILDIARDRLYSGAVGVGAWVGTTEEPREAPIAVRPTEEPGSAILATGLPVSRGFDRESLLDFLPWFQQFKKIRMFGTAALSLVFVASGRVDAYAEDDIKLWDVAAGIALVRAAGGWVGIDPSERLPTAVRVRAAGSASLWRSVGKAVSS